MANQASATIVYDFEKLLQYVAENKIALTPKQSLIPLRHIKAITDQFQIKEIHEHHIGSKIFKKRDEMEYERLYFLDLLAVGSSFLKITGRNMLAKGAHWKTFFAAEPRERGFLIFYGFRHGFNLDAWLSRGGDFGEQLEENAEQIWARVLHWRDEKVVDWKSWAKDTILNCCIHWNSPNQTFANDLAIWGLEYCFLKPLEYFGLVEVERDGGEFARLKSFQLNPTGCDYFSKILRKSGHFFAAASPFSLN